MTGHHWVIPANIKMKKRQYIVNKWSIDPISGFISHQETNEQKRLGEYQLKLLSVLLEHAGKILSRDELTNLVWKRRVIGNNSLPNAVHTLRVALGDDKKQQRIIQTIPKIGYLLDATYCEIIEEDVPDVAAITPVIATTDKHNPLTDGQILAAAPPQNNHNLLLMTANINRQAAPPAVLPAKTHGPQTISISIKIKWLIGLLLLLVIGTGIAGYVIYQSRYAVNFEAVEQGQGIYSHIRMFQINDTRFDQQNGDTLYNRLKDTLYKVNEALKSQNGHLNIYYHISLRRLDYTISVETPCTNKQLNMTIYHWRQNDDLLNNIIYNETVRKINEASAC
jgi:DNA-binding winged helix-turn-helix (wHTH) protein